MKLDDLKTSSPILLQGLSRRFGERVVLDALDLHIPQGQFLAIVGRSGGGKSTLLRLLAGLDQADGGMLQQPAGQSVRVMFQEARLLPWKSVLDNVALGLPANRRGEAEQALAEVGLADRAQEWPARLSGGQRQRGIGAGAGASAVLIIAGRTLGRAGCADPAGNAGSDRAPVAAAWLHHGAGDARCQRSRDPGRPCSPAGSGPRGAGFASRFAAQP